MTPNMTPPPGYERVPVEELPKTYWDKSCWDGLYRPNMTVNADGLLPMVIGGSDMQMILTALKGYIPVFRKVEVKPIELRAIRATTGQCLLVDEDGDNYYGVAPIEWANKAFREVTNGR